MRWRIVPLLMVFVALAHFNRVSISVAGTDRLIRPDLISETRMGMVYSAFLLVYTLFMVPGGWFIDSFGPRTAWVVVGFGSAAGALLTGAAGLAFSGPVSLWLALLAVRSPMGLSNAPLHPAGARLAANWAPPGGVSLVNGLITGAALGGIALTYLTFGRLIDSFGWQRAFLLSGGVTLVVALVWLLAGSDQPLELATALRREAAAPADPPPPGAAGGSDSDAIRTGPAPWWPSGVRGVTRRLSGSLALLRDRGLLCLTLSYAAVGYFQYLFFYWAQYYFERVLGLPKEDGRLNTTFLCLAMGAGMFLGGWLSDRARARLGPWLGPALVPVGGLLLGAAVTALGAYSPDPGMILAYFLAAMAAVGLSEGSFWTAAVRIGGPRGGTAAGILNTGGNAGGLLAPALTPLIAGLFGWQTGLMLASVVCLAGAVLWWGVTPPRGR
jgi:MFS transporter, ACS family, D-galactonate transporter